MNGENWWTESGTNTLPSPRMDSNDTIRKFFHDRIVKPTTSGKVPDWAYQAEISEYRHLEIRKEDFWITYDFDASDRSGQNRAWKLHLNVAPKNVKIVSDYLKRNRYFHKFLSGGESDDGKIFTAYIGSYGLATKVASVLESDLSGLLLAPMNDCDIHFTPNVSGRFHHESRESKLEWIQYPGWYAIKGLPQKWWQNDPDYEDRLEQARISSFEELLRIYGRYFFDSEIARQSGFLSAGTVNGKVEGLVGKNS